MTDMHQLSGKIYETHKSVPISNIIDIKCIPCIVNIGRSGGRELQFDAHSLDEGRMKKDNTMGGTQQEYK